MKKIICNILGCKMRYNFKSQPSKCICVRCSDKYEANYSIFPAKWEKVESFNPELGTDEQLKNRWIK